VSSDHINRSLRLPSLRAIQAFDAVARHGSFSRAADELAVTHGAVSRQVRLLEEELGTRLFRRTSSGATLTDDGEVLFASSRDAFAALRPRRLARRPCRATGH